MGNTLPSGVGTQDINPPNSTFRVLTPLRLSTIVFSGGMVEFAKIGRSDMPWQSLSEIKIYKELERQVPANAVAYDLINTFKFNAGYFGGPKTKLKLDGLDELGKAANPLQPVRSYKFSYNEGTNLPDLGEFYQDWWGYFNISSNVYPTPTSLIHKESVSFGGYTFHVGSTNRDPNADAMQIHILNKITYPTGGYTEFEYEPHYFNGVKVNTRMLSANAGTFGVTDQLFEEAVQFTPTDYGIGTINASFGNMTDPGPNPVFSSVTVTRLSGTPGVVAQLVYDPAIFNPYKPDYETTLYPVLEKDQIYELKVRSKGHSASTRNGGSSYAR